MSTWQRGYDLELLRSIAEPFKRMHKTLVFGAFGLTKEREVAEALARGGMLERRVQGIPGAYGDHAVMLFKQIERDSTGQTDFRHEPIHLQSPALVVTAFAATSRGIACELIKDLMSLRAAYAEKGLYRRTCRVYVEAFEEDAIVCDSLRLSGFSWRATKVMAGSEIKGIYEYAMGETSLPRAEEATLAILRKHFVSAPTLVEIGRALDAVPEWAQHYSSYNKRKSWTSIALRGYSNDPLDIVKPAEMSQAWKAEHPERLADKVRWLPVARRFHAIKRALEKLPTQEFDRVRLMRLRAKDGELTRHADVVDRNAGVADGMIARLHIPLRTSPKVIFSGWGARGWRDDKALPAGCLAYLDQRKPHAVVNSDPSVDRIHLVVDCVSNAALRKLIAGADL